MSQKDPGVPVPRSYSEAVPHSCQPPPKARNSGPGKRPGNAPSVLSQASLPQIDLRLFDLLSQARARHHLFPASTRMEGAPTTVVVAVSGGADSVTLLHLLTRLRADWSLHLVVAHLDHGLRPDSADDARFVAALANRWGLPLATSALPPGALAHQGNLEAAARRARYRFLARVAVDHQIDGGPVEVALAHTANDQAETLLMNLIRGSGLDGLAAMRAVRPLLVDGQRLPGVRVVRPLLAVSRTEILHYLNHHTIPWREDPTNQDRTFVRNRVRHEILPRLQEINPQVVASLCRTASLLADEAQRADSHTRKALRTTRRSEEAACAGKRQENRRPPSQEPPHVHSNRQIFDLSAFRALDTADQRATLRAAGLCLGLSAARLGFDATERLRQTLIHEDRAGGPYSWVADLMLTRSHHAFSLHRRDAAPFVADHPYLDGKWRARNRARPLPAPGEIALGGWTLRGVALHRANLPQSWPSRPPRSYSEAVAHSKLSRWEAYIDADCVERLTLGAPRPGQRFAPLGLGGHGKALADYFTDRKVPPSLRRGWPILLDGANIVWVGGFQIADSVRITDRSRRIFHLYWEETPR